MFPNHKPYTKRLQAPDKTLPPEFKQLTDEAEQLWTEKCDTPAFHAYVSADYEAVYESLAELRGQVHTVLEWGSGLGVVTIMASRMGFEAYGIEVEPQLVEYAKQFAEAYGNQAQFAQGSFVPDDFVWNPSSGDEAIRTMIDTPGAYGQWDMELQDFDLVYAYPWPDERTFYHNIMRDCGRCDALLLSYDAREGVELVRFNKG
ncbi:MAG: class I SAM-dependent methyltransferase [Pirellulales bacterium]|nr:class I SAM-dependent methyltransferase [Pirellulales bacterium]